MAELPGYTFRFEFKASEVIEPLLRHLPPWEQDRILRRVEPVLMKRDRDLEDAITRALGCCHS